MSDKLVARVFCYKCKREMGTVDPGELACLLQAGIDHCLCFDCEGDAPNSNPDFFWDWWNGDHFFYGGTVWTAFVDGLFVHILKPVPLSRMSTHMRACLSSSTYLNTQKPKQGGEGYCPNCGEAELRVMEEEYFCPACLAQFPKMVELVLPRWILGEGS